jgi:hypothetical protein
MIIMVRYQRLEVMGTTLQRGDVLVPRSSSGYALKIPSFNDPVIKSFAEAARGYAGSTTGMQRAGKLVSFVHERIQYDDHWGEGRKEVSLAESIREGKGKCKDIAAAYQMLMQLEQMQSKYLRGTMRTETQEGGHAWLMVNSDGETRYACPTNARFGRYASATRLNGCTEELQVILRKKPPFKLRKALADFSKQALEAVAAFFRQFQNNRIWHSLEGVLHNFINLQG